MRVDTGRLDTMNPDVRPRFQDLRVINAQALLAGRVTRLPDGRIETQFRLWDVVAENQVAGVQYVTTPGNWRTLAHAIANYVYERLSGQIGHFEEERLK